MLCAGELTVERAVELGVVSAPEPPPTDPLERQWHEWRVRLEQFDRHTRAYEAGEVTTSDAEQLEDILYADSRGAPRSSSGGSLRCVSGRGRYDH